MKFSLPHEGVVVLLIKSYKHATVYKNTDHFHNIITPIINSEVNYARINSILYLIYSYKIQKIVNVGELELYFTVYEHYCNTTNAS